MNRKRRFQLRAFKETGYLLQTFAVPFARKQQDKVIRRVYKSANIVRGKAGLPSRMYLMLNSKGEWEMIS